MSLYTAKTIFSCCNGVLKDPLAARNGRSKTPLRFWPYKGPFLKKSHFFKNEEWKKWTDPQVFPFLQALGPQNVRTKT